MMPCAGGFTASVSPTPIGSFFLDQEVLTRSIELPLHTGYADLRYGAFVPRNKVKEYLSLHRNDTSSFVIWLNQYPWLLANPTTHRYERMADDVLVSKLPPEF